MASTAEKVISAEEWKAKGNVALSAGNHDDAIDCYTNAIKLDAMQHVFYSNRSAAYLSKEMATDALKDASECIRLKPDWPKGYSRKGAALHKLKQYDEAMKVYKTGLEIDPSNGACQNGLNEVKNIVENSSNPLGNIFGPDVEMKIRANPRISHLANDASFMAIMKELQSNPNSMNMHLKDPRVMTCLTELMGLNSMTNNPAASSPISESNKSSIPDDHQTSQVMDVELTNDEKTRAAALDAKKRGNELYKKKEFSPAIVCYTEAIDIDPTDMSFLSNRAAVHFEMNNLDACITDCKEAIKVARENRADYALVAKAYVRIGNAYMKKGGEFLPLALENYETAQIENRTKDVEYKIKKAQLENKKALAQAYIDPAKALDAKEIGNTFFKAGDFPAAVVNYTEAIKRDPTNAVYYANRAAAYTKLTSFNEAKGDCEKALDLDPKYVKAWSRLAAIQCLMKEYHKAMKSYETGIAIDPSNAECKDGHARVVYLIQQSQGGEQDKERTAHAMADPDIQAILRDPVMQNVLEDFQSDPKAAQRHLKNAGVMEKIQKLIAAGVLQTK